MFKSIAGLIIASLLLITSSGCVAVVAGAAGGAGTAVWFSGKLSQEVNVPFDRAIEASKRGLESLKLQVIKETRKKEVAQIMSKYSNGKTIWIDVHRITEQASKIEVRVGVVPDKESTEKVLKQISLYL